MQHLRQQVQAAAGPDDAHEEQAQPAGLQWKHEEGGGAGQREQPAKERGDCAKVWSTSPMSTLWRGFQETAHHASSCERGPP